MNTFVAMPNYRRVYEPGGMFFFTLVTYRRRPFLCEEKARRLLHAVIEDCQRLWPFEIDAVVLLPDHLHWIWTLPVGDSAYSRRLGWLKKTFTQRWLATGGTDTPISQGQRTDGRRGVWQPKFFEHTVSDQGDLNAHLDYIHYNPVKHGLVQCPHQWPYSSFRKWIKRQAYAKDWQCRCGVAAPTPLVFNTLKVTDFE